MKVSGAVAMADDPEHAFGENWRVTSHGTLEPQVDETSGWQPIETFPRDGEAYLATDNRVQGGFPQVVFWTVIGRLEVPDAKISYNPYFFTHWMHIPDAP